MAASKRCSLDAMQGLVQQMSSMRLGGRVELRGKPTLVQRAVAVRPAQRGALQVRAARVGGVDIPNNKLIEFSLQYIFGVGHTTAKAILASTGVENKRTFELTEEELQVLRAELDKYMTEGDLRRFNALNIKRLKEIGSYRGRRHIMGLPVNGQRTKTNARTRKGKRKTVAGKKIAVKR